MLFRSCQVSSAASSCLWYGVAVGVASVSYTHLDVYKRQFPVAAFVCSALFSRHPAVPGWKAFSAWLCGTSWPVSYTHLRSAGADMAVTKIHPIKSTLKKALNYIENPAKKMCIRDRVKNGRTDMPATRRLFFFCRRAAGCSICVFYRFNLTLK